MSEQEYPEVCGKSPDDMMMETNDIEGGEIFTERAIYNITEDLWITIKPEYRNVDSEDDYMSTEWVVLVGATKQCSERSVGPFNSVDNAVSYVEDKLVDN